MRVKIFIDTNLLVYTQRADNPVKQQIARSLLDNYNCVASTQVLNEFCNIFTRKYPVPVTDIETIINTIVEVCEISFVSADTIRQALALHKKYQYPYYDCLIIASALESGCEYLFTEDLQDGQVINNKLKIVNVFKHSEEFIG